MFFSLSFHLSVSSFLSLSLSLSFHLSVSSFLTLALAVTPFLWLIVRTPHLFSNSSNSSRSNWNAGKSVAKDTSTLGLVWAILKSIGNKFSYESSLLGQIQKRSILKACESNSNYLVSLPQEPWSSIRAVACRSRGPRSIPTIAKCFSFLGYKAVGKKLRTCRSKVGRCLHT